MVLILDICNKNMRSWNAIWYSFWIYVIKIRGQLSKSCNIALVIFKDIFVGSIGEMIVPRGVVPAGKRNMQLGDAHQPKKPVCARHALESQPLQKYQQCTSYCKPKNVIFRLIDQTNPNPFQQFYPKIHHCTSCLQTDAFHSLTCHKEICNYPKLRLFFDLSKFYTFLFPKNNLILMGKTFPKITFAPLAMFFQILDLKRKTNLQPCNDFSKNLTLTESTSRLDCNNPTRLSVDILRPEPSGLKRYISNVTCSFDGYTYISCESHVPSQCGTRDLTISPT